MSAVSCALVIADECRKTRVHYVVYQYSTGFGFTEQSCLFKSLCTKKKSINLLIKAEKLLDTFTIQNTSLALSAKDNSQQLQTQRWSYSNVLPQTVNSSYPVPPALMSTNVSPSPALCILIGKGILKGKITLSGCTLCWGFIICHSIVCYICYIFYSL